MASQADYEKLGAFYLGKIWDPEKGKPTDDLLLYDAKDLTTHAVCVGMTGSGKTGLCMTLLEEAAIDGIPALLLDLKGDLTNLMLTFPELRPADFLPWVDPGEASRKGQTVEEYAKSRADLWRRGLAQWDQDGSRIARLRESADFTIYTPGSNAGMPLTILRSFNAPPAELIDDVDAFRERIGAAVSGLLALLGIDADPIRSREHILLSNILDRAWRAGKNLDLATLIGQIQSPPFDKIGVFDLETFFGAGDRLGLAMTLNNLLASPGFSAWMQGEPLDVQRLLWTPEGKPRMSILSIAHLNDSERMFFMTVLLNEVISWMRTQSGTSSLRALLYIDEVFGYLPPTANPPSKKPLLTLLKQGRAFGLGTVLATQNPVDLDYKALSNAGTWFLGRLQTERDKLRVLDGLEGASASTGAKFDRARIEAQLSGLDSRVFLMNNVHEDEPVLFHTRWALSYLRGPLTRDHIRTLMADRKTASVAAARSGPVRAPREATAEPPAQKPAIPAGVEERFLPDDGSAADGEVLYRPYVLGEASLHYANSRAGVDLWRDVRLLAPLDGDGDLWEESEPEEQSVEDMERSAPLEGRYAELPAAARKKRSFTSWGTRLKSHLYRTAPLSLWKCRELKQTSKPGESEGDFRARLTSLAHEKRDLAVEKLRKRYTPKLARIEERIRKAQVRVDKEESQYGQQKTQTAISIGATLLGALFGRKVKSAGTVGRAATAVRGAGRAMRERGDIARAQEEVEVLTEKLGVLQAEFEEDVAEVQDAALDAMTIELDELPVRPRKSDTSVKDVVLVWTPWVVRDGVAQPAF